LIRISRFLSASQPHYSGLEIFGLYCYNANLGKAQEVCSALTLEQSLDYDAVKMAVLRAYELVPEAYQQKLGNLPSQTFVEFAREKTTLFEKWCVASKITTFEQLKELILVDEVKNCISEKIVVYLN